MTLFVRLTLSLAILLAGFPVAGSSVSGGCSVSVASNEAACCSYSQKGCCCQPDYEVSQKVSCCHPDEDSPAADLQIASGQKSSVDVAGHSKCGGEQCPCSMHGCCGQVSASLLFILVPQGVSENLVSSDVSEWHNQFSSRSDRPLVPPPKVQLAI